MYSTVYQKISNNKNFEIRTWSASKFFPIGTEKSDNRSVPLRRMPEERNEVDLSRGRKVNHQKYGVGVIVGGSWFYLAVDFGTMGVQFLDLDGDKVEFLDSNITR